MKSLDLMCPNREPGANVLYLILADREQGLGMGQRQVCSLIGRSITHLKDQAAAGLPDLNKRAALRLVGKVALAHALAFPLLPDQAGQRRSDDEQALCAHAVWPLSW